MKKVKVLESFHVAATGITYTKGQEAEVSDELAKRKEGKYLKILKPASVPASNPEVKAEEK